MPPSGTSLQPHAINKSLSVRRAYIQKLTELLHVCLLRGELERAKRAWSILIHCREVDWRSRWQWGLLILNSSTTSTFGSSPSQMDGREAERWLRSLCVAAKEIDKPSLLHALILHLIKHGRHGIALDELETYLSSYPYLTSGALHTYAGLLSFYLAQPSSAVGPSSQTNRLSPGQRPLDLRSDTVTSSRSERVLDPPNAGMIRRARGWFSKAMELDPNDEVAKEFIQQIDRPQLSDDDDDSDNEMEGNRKSNERASDLPADSEIPSDGAYDENDDAWSD